MYIYTLVRKDIPIADQLVQTGHACLEAGYAFPTKTKCNLVLLELEDLDHLQNTVELLQKKNIQFITFTEPDDNMGLTAICTEPIFGNRRKVLQKFKLWELS